jgi:hypothetical protein
VIGEAFDTAVTLGLALLAWIALLSAVVVAALYTVVAVACCAVRATVRGAKASRAALSVALRASSPSEALRELHDAPGASQAPSRPAPAWAQPDKDAA